MKRVLTAAALLAACQAAAERPHGEGEREGHPAKLAADAFVRQIEVNEQAAALRREVEPMKPRRWIFEGPGGECRMLERYTFRLDRSGGGSSKGKRMPSRLSSMYLNLDGEPCPDGVRLPWRRRDGR